MDLLILWDIFYAVCTIIWTLKVVMPCAITWGHVPASAGLDESEGVGGNRAKAAKGPVLGKAVVSDGVQDYVKAR